MGLPPPEAPSRLSRLSLACEEEIHTSRSGGSSEPERSHDPGTLPRLSGLEVRGYVHDLFQHLAACDLGIVQGGLTTTTELTVRRRPFLYFPLRNHREQVYHVAYRLDQ